MLFIVKNAKSKKTIIQKLSKAKNLDYDFDHTYTPSPDDSD